MNAASKISPSEEIRANLNHPVLDCDGHYIEFMPYYFDFVEQVGGLSMVEAFRKNRIGETRMAPSPWNNMNREQRQHQLRWRRPFHALPSRNTKDRATAMIPRLLYERMDEIGVDFGILYPTIGLDMLFIKDEEIRQAACRALNAMNAEVWKEYSDRMAPVAVIPTVTPEEGVAELDFAVGKLGLKGIMISGNVHRHVPQVAEEAPEWKRHAMWYDHMAMDSQYDYDPFWAKCVEHKVAPTAHAGHQGIGSFKSISSYVYNHIGSFAEANHAFCKAVFLGGVAKRFPELKFGFLEGGVGWAMSLLSDTIEHWEKRNKNAIGNYDPKELDVEKLASYFREFGGDAIKGREDSFVDYLEGLRVDFENPGELDEFADCACETKEDIRAQFGNFFFGCEADDKINSFAFQGPKERHLNAMFSSDISHWDVPDIRECVSEAHELVESGQMTDEDFEQFMFVNPARLHAGMNPDFFKGTRVEGEIEKLKMAGRL
jgi:predicted TIM-barrel fold metal-dependent hydrolase